VRLVWISIIHRQPGHASFREGFVREALERDASSGLAKFGFTALLIYCPFYNLVLESAEALELCEYILRDSQFSLM
jgi:hypothetical protein